MKSERSSKGNLVFQSELDTQQPEAGGGESKLCREDAEMSSIRPHTYGKLTAETWTVRGLDIFSFWLTEQLEVHVVSLQLAGPVVS